MASVPTFNEATPNGVASSTEYNENWSQLAEFLGNDLIHRDGSKAFTGQVQGADSDPTDDLHLVNKGWAEQRLPYMLAYATQTAQGTTVEWSSGGTTFTDIGLEVTFECPELAARLDRPSKKLVIEAYIPKWVYENGTGGSGSMVDNSWFGIRLYANGFPLQEWNGSLRTYGFEDATPSTLIRLVVAENVVDAFEAGQDTTIEVKGACQAGKFTPYSSVTNPAQLTVVVQ